MLIRGDCGIRRLGSPAPLTLHTFCTALPLTAPPGSISSTFGEQLSRGGREHCLLCKGFYLPLLYVALYFFLPHCSPTFISHMAPLGAIIWQHPPPTRNHLLPHDKHAHAAVTPQENALTSSGCTTHMIIGGELLPEWQYDESTPTVMYHLFMKRMNNFRLYFKMNSSRWLKYEGIFLRMWSGGISLHRQVMYCPMTVRCWSWQHPDFSSLH